MSGVRSAEVVAVSVLCWLRRRCKRCIGRRDGVVFAVRGVSVFGLVDGRNGGVLSRS